MDTGKAIRTAKVLAAEAVITLVFLCLFAFVLEKLQPSEGAVRMGIRVLYAAVNFIGGILIGKIMHQKRFLWGAVMGLLYFAVISVISFVIHGSFYADIQNALTICLLCIAGGMAGGMVS